MKMLTHKYKSWEITVTPENSRIIVCAQSAQQRFSREFNSESVRQVMKNVIKTLEHFYETLKNSILETNGFSMSFNSTGELFINYESPLKTGANSYPFQLEEKKVEDLKEELSLELPKLKKETIEVEKRISRVENENSKLNKALDHVSDSLKHEIDILKDLMLNPPKIDSTIIASKLEANYLYQWLGSTRLIKIYQASTDGWDSTSFHEKVDKCTPTLVVIKTNTKKIIGGFTDQTWNHTGNFKPTDHSRNNWLFSLTLGRTFPVMIGRENQAIFAHNDKGPTFGDGDLEIPKDAKESDSLCNIGNSYENDQGTLTSNHFAGGDKFKCLEIEVFHIN